MTTPCPNCGDPLDAGAVWGSLAPSVERRGRARCGSCAKHLTVKATSFVAVLAVTVAAVLLVSLVADALGQYGGGVLVAAVGAICAAAAFCTGYLAFIRFEVASDRGPALTAARLADLDG